jgi:uncharacterized DUF497 family protein
VGIFSGDPWGALWFAASYKYTEGRKDAWVRFVWDVKKAATNLRKHGVSFQEASSVFFDPLSVTGDDPDHSFGERRSVTFGMSSSGRLLVVAHADQEDAIRILSARMVTRAERALYEEG